MGIPDDLSEKDVAGLTQATQNIVKHLVGPHGYQLDLSNIENIRRRDDGHLVITDPVSI